MREALYPIEDVSAQTGLEESKIRYLEKEFGRFFRFTEVSPLKKQFNLRQISILRRISYLWQEKGLPLETIKSQIDSIYSNNRAGVWTIAVTSGKGGVGKTSIVTNLSVKLASRGLKTVVFDADMGLANAHVLMGVTPRYTLHDLLRNDVGMEDIILEGPAGVKLIPGGSGILDLADMKEVQRDFLIREIKKISDEADVVIIDTAAGISANVVRFLAFADQVILAATPSIISLLDAYGVVKTMYERRISTPVSLLVNMVRGAAQAREVHTKIDQCAQQFLNRRIDFLGYIKKDLNADRAVQQQKPLALAYPHSPASLLFQKVAGRLAETARTQSRAKRQNNLTDIFLKEE